MFFDSFFSVLLSALHSLHASLNRTNQDDKLGLVLDTQQTHIIYRRSLIRVFRFIDDNIQRLIINAKIRTLLDELQQPTSRVSRQLRITDGQQQDNRLVVAGNSRGKNRTNLQTTTSTKQLYLPGNHSSAESYSSSGRDSQNRLNVKILQQNHQPQKKFPDENDSSPESNSDSEHANDNDKRHDSRKSLQNHSSSSTTNKNEKRKRSRSSSSSSSSSSSPTSPNHGGSRLRRQTTKIPNYSDKNNHHHRLGSKK